MSNYRRASQPGGIFFFTVVAFGRRDILTLPTTRTALRKALDQTRGERPFETVAAVLLPDHLHTVWQLPPGDGDFSTRWRLIKTRGTRAVQGEGLDVTSPRETRRRRHERGVWQPRFWEHLVRDNDDLRRHVDYVHWNPVKHGLVKRVQDWPYSTCRRYVRRGIYPPDWGAYEPPSVLGMDVEGE